MTTINKGKALTVPMVLAVPIVVMLFMTVAYYLYERDYRQSFNTSQRDRVQSELNTVRSHLDDMVNRKLQFTRTLSSYIEVRGDISAVEFQKIASQLYAEQGHGIRSIQVARGTTITYYYPMEGGEAVKGLDLLSLPAQAREVQRTIASRQMVLAGPLHLVQGGEGVVIRKPIYLPDEHGSTSFWGMATVVIDWPSLLQISGLPSHERLELSIRDLVGDAMTGKPFYGSSELLERDPVKLEMNLPGRQWELNAIPKGGWKTLPPDSWLHRSVALLLITLTGLFSVWRIRYPSRLHRAVAQATQELQVARNQLEQRVAERTREVLEGERQRRTLLDNIPFPLVVTRLDTGEVLYNNVQAAQLFEIPIGSTGRFSPDFYVDKNERHQIVERIKAAGKVLNHEIQMRTESGRRFYALISAVAIHYGDCEAILVVTNDISERKRIDLALQASEENFRKAFVYTPTPTVITRLNDSRVLKINPAAVALFGLNGLEDTELYAKDYYEDLREREVFRELLLGNGYVKDFEVRMKDYQGNHLELLLSSVKIEFAGEDAVLIGLTDITSRKEAERSLQQAKIDAEQAVRAKNEFLATMSHEIRTPLNGALTMLKVLERTELTTAQREYATAISFSGESLLMLLNDVLDLSKIEAGMLEIEEVDFDIRMLVHEMVSLMRPLAERNNLEFRYKIDEVLPVMLHGDSTRIRQVLFNLLGNAIKFTEAGMVELHVMIVTEHDDSIEVQFTVRDTGIGIAEVMQQRLFTPFSQGDSSIARRYGGTGLGLAICRRLVEAMGGSIAVESVPDRGSTFWFRLQLTRGVAPTVDLSNSTMDSAALQEKLRVLLVEDNDINRRAASALLAMDGCDVQTANDGLDALALLKVQEFDVVLMDIHMPGIDGLETTRRLRNMGGLNGTVPVFALTADITQDNIEECLQLGMDSVLTKPISISKLREALNSIQKGRQTVVGEA